MKNYFILPTAVLFLLADCLANETINPFPKKIIKTTLVKVFNFKDGLCGWDKCVDCSAFAKNGKLVIISSNSDPKVICKNISYQPPLKILVKSKTTTKGNMQLFWTTASSPAPTPNKMVNISTIPDGKWHTYSAVIPEKERITGLRLDPFSEEGEIKIDFIKIIEIKYHPLEILSVSQVKNQVSALVTNHSSDKITFYYEGKKYNILPSSKITVTREISTNTPFKRINFNLKFKNRLPNIVRPVNVINWSAETNWINIKSGNIKLKISPDGSGIKIVNNKKVCAAIFPVAQLNNKILKFDVSVISSNAVKLTSDLVNNFAIKINNNQIKYYISCDKKIIGPTIRLKSQIEQALLPGVEYLGKNEKSSTDFDIKTPAHIRFKPNKMWVTMPLIAFVTPDSSLAMIWKNMNLQPYFAVPDFFNGADSALAALEGKNIQVVIKITNVEYEKRTLESLIEWAVKKTGLPPLPTPPRSDKDEIKLCLRGIEAVHGSNGWGHCIQNPPFTKAYFADYVSLIWRVTGKLIQTPNLVPGGSHLPSPESFFITGRAGEWLKIQRQRAEKLIKSQNPDGSFRYNGKFRKGHFENTASGYCAASAEALLRIAYYTGDSNALTAGIKALDYIFRFRTPRGSQTWEIPLHTPDILASARLTKSYLLGYKLTGNKKYLDAARKWAMTGVPFVYLYGNKPIMKYATIAVLGATGWIAPNWMGLPVQWCGLTYADAILDLAKYDKTFPWKKLAKGIFICAEQMQYTEGKAIGTLPDSFTLETQTRNIYDIGPLMLIQFQRRFAGKPTGIYVARDKKNIVTAPFPVKIKDRKAIINVSKKIDYQVIVNGKIKNMKSGSNTLILH